MIIAPGQTFSSNTYYPAGAVCASQVYQQFCPTSGESGSVLMTGSSDSKYRAEGVLSFTKGCDQLTFGVDVDNDMKWSLRQESSNPVVYTKLNCYLPWIAAQYNLYYSGATDASCSEATGDINDAGDVARCANTPANIEQGFLNTELPCIFPFYLNGVRYDSCILFSNEDIIFPINRCPIRNITTKIDGINSYTADDLQELIESYNYCTVPGAPGDLLPTLDPGDNSCSAVNRRSAFSQCKNNCPGGLYMSLL